MSPPRVLMIALHFAEYSVALAQALAGHAQVQMQVLLYQDNADNELGAGWAGRAARAGFDAVGLARPRRPAGIWRNARDIAKAVASFRPDIVHIQEAWRDETVLAWPSWRRVPMVLTVHDPLPHTGRDTVRMKNSRRRWYRRFLRDHATASVTHGAVLKEQLVADTPHLQGRVHLAPHGPLGGPSQPMPTGPATPRLLLFGRIEAYKGLRHFADAVTDVYRSGVAVEGVVAGRGDDLALYRQRMLNAGCFDIRDRYIAVDEVNQLFTGCSGLVLPYIEGTQSGVAAMALGYGRPVIATRVGSIPEMVRDGVNGLLVPPADSSALAAAIRAFATQPALRAALAAGARELATGDLSWVTAARCTLSAYEQVLRRAAR
ncbi:MAG: glycosyltransferase family 4 protein [Burkholderiaceae bacterium]|nr:glycosyltransferase family 4 protein [Burkholderiaceae bacterium]